MFNKTLIWQIYLASSQMQEKTYFLGSNKRNLEKSIVLRIMVQHSERKTPTQIHAHIELWTL